MNQHENFETLKTVKCEIHTASSSLYSFHVAMLYWVRNGECYNWFSQLWWTKFRLFI